MGHWQKQKRTRLTLGMQLSLWNLFGVLYLCGIDRIVPNPVVLELGFHCMVLDHWNCLHICLASGARATSIAQAHSFDPAVGKSGVALCLPNLVSIARRDDSHRKGLSSIHCDR